MSTVKKILLFILFYYFHIPHIFLLFLEMSVSIDKVYSTLQHVIARVDQLANRTDDTSEAVGEHKRIECTGVAE